MDGAVSGTVGRECGLISPFASMINSITAWPGDGWAEDDARQAELRD